MKNGSALEIRHDSVRNYDEAVKKIFQAMKKYFYFFILFVDR